MPKGKFLSKRDQGNKILRARSRLIILINYKFSLSFGWYRGRDVWARGLGSSPPAYTKKKEEDYFN